MRNVVAVVLLIVGASAAEEITYRICATESISESACSALQTPRVRPSVVCVRVTDSADCAIKIAKQEADFGVFNAEEILLAYQFYPNELQTILELRSPNQTKDAYEFATVAVVSASYDDTKGLEGLRKSNLCHPGFSKTQNWNDYILKYFERKTYFNWCSPNYNVAENEARDLSDFFGKTCRPGEWVSDDAVDKKLKLKYPQLCDLCNDKPNCSYRNSQHHGHYGALECLESGRGKVAYVALNYVKEYFGLSSSTPPMLRPNFNFLCPDGTTRSLSDPCPWLKQPWSAVLARKFGAGQLMKEMKAWLTSQNGEAWTTTLKSIIEGDATAIYPLNPTSLGVYLNGRNVELPKSCGNNVRWCTVSEPENNKCKWVAAEAHLLGIDPSFSCVAANSTFDCMRKIADGKADIVTIDSNYGYIARKVFNLTTAMYSLTDITKNSEVIAVVRENAGKPITSFKDLKKRTACFPEYGGIAWISFLNTVRSRKIVSNSCDYPKVVANFLSGACTPGIKDADHAVASRTAEASAVLCSLCPIESTNATCSANADNKYYGDKGALECLMGAGDIAFVEAKNLLDHIAAGVINPDDFRVLCKNGSLATHKGFDVDKNCALSATIDSEIVTRKGQSQIFMDNLELALLSMEDSLGYSGKHSRPIRIYDSPQGQSDLLFKDTTIALVSTSSQIETVLAYKELFSHVEICSGGAMIVANIFTLFLVIFVIFTRSN